MPSGVSVLTDATADLALTLMLMAARRAGEGERGAGEGDNGHAPRWTPHEVISANHPHYSVRDPAGNVTETIVRFIRTDDSRNVIASIAPAPPTPTSRRGSRGTGAWGGGTTSRSVQYVCSTLGDVPAPPPLCSNMGITVRPGRLTDPLRTRAVLKAHANGTADDTYLKAIRVLADLGAGPSMAQYAFIQSLPDECFLERRPADARLGRHVGATGAAMEITGYVCLLLHMRERLVPTWFHVVKGLSVDALIGTDVSSTSTAFPSAPRSWAWLRPP